ncbi:unnamed protein product [Adineta ricciae]|uniref:Uncharacterized protein n=1 Tax=Adineta ricciae TaxID=249248 RepID=A0A815EFM5_ADIRI|nr:unnamed protein product [Adineta ricciae]CAF1311219.1 unnamed protein product [Adineta ricciae]
MSTNKIIQCGEFVAYNLLRFLDGVDAINFIEAVDSSEQFGSIAEVFDHRFIILISTFCNHQRIRLPDIVWHYYRDVGEIDEENFCVIPERYSFFIQPSERLYIHPCFSLEGFLKLCEVYQTPLFKCYSRLLSWNSVYYNAGFALLDYEWYSQTVGSKRTLNGHEKSLFKIQKTLAKIENGNEYQNMTFVHTVEEFKLNLTVRFSSALWLEAIDFSKFIIVGGCVLNSLCKLPFHDTKDQDINLIYYINSLSDFEVTVQRDKIISTFPFLQALATRSFIVYNLYGESPKHLCTRISKYCNRGFDLLLPIGFDGDLKSMMKQEDIPFYRIESKKYIDDEGEVHTSTTETYRGFMYNVDTFRLQEKFMLNVCPKLLEYK